MPVRASILLLAVLLPAVAHGQAEDARSRAKTLYEQGEEHLKGGRYDEAIQSYRQAYDLAPLPGFLYNLGQAYRLKGERERAISYYEKYLAAEPHGKASDAARAHLEELKKQVSTDRARAENEARRKAEEARRKAEEDLARNDEPTPGGDAPPPDEVERERIVDERPPTPPRPGRGLRLAGYSLLGGGVVLAGLGAVFGMRASAISDELSRPPMGGQWTQEQNDRIAEGEAAERNMYICYGVGAAALAGGAALLYYGIKAGRTDAVATTVTPVATPHGVALSVEGTF